MSWTEDRVNLLKQLWGEGKSASEIAKQLGGVSRNAVIGKVHRMKLSGRATVSAAPAKKTAPAKAPANANAAPRPAPSAPAQPRSPVKKHAVKLGQQLQLAALKERSCRWPNGDPQEKDFSFCGCDAMPGLPYCEDHAVIAYQVGRPRNMKAEDFERAEERQQAAAAQ